jgi:outer membrane receptor protein involved in Fe transport
VPICRALFPSASHRSHFHVLAILFLLPAITLVAQVDKGEITGVVTGPANAVITAAWVSAVNAANGLKIDATPNSAGAYVLPNLPPGEWDLSAGAAGLAGAKAHLEVVAGRMLRVDISLLSNQSAIVERHAGARALEDHLSGKQLLRLPSLTIDPYEFVAIVPNVSPTDPSGLGAGYAANGLRAAGTNFVLNGSGNNDEFSATAGQRVPLESIEELNILTGAFTAEYGRASAAVLNVVTRSGGAQFHGSAYEFARMSAVDSNSFLNNANRVAKSVYDRNQFGYAIGGPILRNKLFFFQNTEFLRVRGDQAQFALVPTPQFITAAAPATQAFFSQYGTLRPDLRILNTFTRGQLNPCTRGAAITDPCVALAASPPMFNEVTWQSPSDTGGGAPENTYAVVGNIDYNWTSRTRLSARYALWNESDFAGTVSSSPYAGYDTGQKFFDNRIALAGDHQWSPTLSISARLAFNRLSNQQPLGSNPTGPTLYMNALTAVSLAGQPIALPGYNPESPGAATPSGGPQNIGNVGVDATRLFRRHDLRFGGEFTYIQDNRTFGAYEEAAEGLGTTVGNAIDGFLTGQLHEFDAAINPQGKLPGQTLALPAFPPSFSRSDRYRDSALYAQDTWRFTPRLTLNLGVRWEYYGIQHNSAAALDSNFYPGAGSNLPQQIAAGAISTVPNSSLGKLWKPDWRNFAPRLGLAYDLFGDGRTVFRAGYGIGYQPPFGNLTFNVIQNPPNYAVVSLIAGADLPLIPIATGNSGPLSSSGTQVLPPASLRAIDPDLRTAYAHLFSAALEQSFGNSTSASLAYSGSRGEQLYSVSNVNPAGAGNAYLGAACTPGSFGFPGTCTQRLDPQYSDIDFRANGGASNYNAAIARVVTRNFWRTGITLEANYTFSHTIDNLSSAFSYSPHGNFVLGFLDPFAPSLDRGNSDFDVRHRVAVSGVWQIPWFHGTGLRDRIIGGWEIAPIFTFRTGSPFTLYDCANAYNFCERAETAGPLPGRGTTNVPASGIADNFLYYQFAGAITSQAGVWYNPTIGISDFGPFPSNMLGRNTVYTRGNWNLDAGLYKTARLTEKASLELRLELYNALNHANFYVNTSDADVSSFAAVDGYFNGNRNVQLGARLTF